MPIAYVLINTNSGTEEKFLKEIRKIEAVKEAHIVMGEFDVIATLKSNTMRDLKYSINYELRHLDNLVSTQTLIAIL